MKVKSIVLSAFSILAATAITSQAQLGLFDASSDIDGGALGAAGSAEYDPNTGTYTVNGSGDDIWNEADSFHFLYKSWSGDFDIRARINIDGGLPEQDWIKAMIMARETTDPSSINIGTRVRRDGQYSTQWRSSPTEWSSTPGDLRVTGKNGARQRFVRRGDTFGTYFQDDGSSEWQIVDANTLEINSNLLIGFAVTAHDEGEIATGTFSEVSITVPTALSGDVITLQEGVDGYEGTKDAHIISWDGSQNQLGRLDDGSNAGNGTETPPPGGDPQNAGAHEFIEEGDFGGGTDDSKVILIEFDTSGVDASSASRLLSAQIGLYYSHERSAGGNGEGPTNPAAGDNNPHLISAQMVLKSWDEGDGGDVDAGSNVDGVDTPDNSGAVTWNSTGSELWEAIGAEGPSDVGPVISTTFFDASIPGHWVWVDVTDAARKWIADPSTNNGVKISQETDNIPENPPSVYVDGAYNFVSSDNEQVNLRPILQLEFINESNVGDEWSLYR